MVLEYRFSYENVLSVPLLRLKTEQRVQTGNVSPEPYLIREGHNVKYPTEFQGNNDIGSYKKQCDILEFLFSVPLLSQSYIKIICTVGFTPKTAELLATECFRVGYTFLYHSVYLNLARHRDYRMPRVFR